jgi:hypothetical protein
MTEECACTARGEMKIYAYKYFVGRPEAKKLLTRHIYMWEDNISTDLKEI